ncbi:MAG: hypothetical protein KGL39_12635 [Patescibacteria group bacterium]|nr:hypothetical protein [Patescibacteria group bacterium]
MSIVKYNGITLPYSHITNVSQEAIYDDSSTDHLFNRFDVTIQAVLNSNYVATISSSIPNQVTNPADIMSFIRHKLLAPRRLLSIGFNGTELTPARQQGDPIPPDPNEFIDAKNGPQPQYCKIDQLTNTTFLITYRVVAHYHECPIIVDNSKHQNIVQNKAGNAVLSNRWSESVVMDENQYTKRSRTGRIILRSDNIDGLTPDQLRSDMAVVGVPEGFIRESSEYSITPDGLMLEYHIVDREVFKMPPRPAFKSSGRYTEIKTQNGAITLGQVEVHLEGDKVTKQDDLVAIALYIACQKLAVRSKTPGSPFQDIAIMNFSRVSVGLYDNTVDVIMQGMFKNRSGINRINNTKARFCGTNGFRIAGITITPPSPLGGDGKPNYMDRGTTNILLQAAAFYDPCIRNQKVELKTGQFPGDDYIGEATLTSELPE